MEPVKYRTYNSEERAKANAKWKQIGATHAQRNVVDSTDLGDCELSRRCGKNYIYRFKNPVGEDPPKLTAVQLRYIAEKEKLPRLPFCLSHLL